MLKSVLIDKFAYYNMKQKRGNAFSNHLNINIGINIAWNYLVGNYNKSLNPFPFIGEDISSIIMQTD